MLGGDNVPDEFKKLFADILGDGSSGSGENGSGSKNGIGAGALDEEDYEELKKEAESLTTVDFITEDPSKVYQIVSKLGAGGFAKVFLVKRLADNA